MKLFLKRLLVMIPDQVLSTFFFGGFFYIWIRGIMAIINEPPSRSLIFIVLFIGIVLGVLAALTGRKLFPNEEDDGNGW